MHWLVTSAALLAGRCVALLRARRTAKRLERLTESYWELRYENGQLRARVARLEPADAAAGGAARVSRPRQEPDTTTISCPLSSLKR